MKLAMERDYYLKLKDELKSFKKFATNNIGLLFTSIYFMVSFSGVIHLSLLLKEFNTNIFYHMELSDYLSAVLTNSHVMAMFLGYAVGVAIILVWRLNRIPKARKNTWYNRLWCKVMSPIYSKSPLVTLILSSFLALVLYSIIASSDTASSIKKGKVDVYDVTLNYPIQLREQTFSQLENVAIVAVSSSNLFVYQYGLEQLLIIPQSNLALLLPKSNITAVQVSQQQGN